jgi:hypothetical protein
MRGSITCWQILEWFERLLTSQEVLGSMKLVSWLVSNKSTKILCVFLMCPLSVVHALHNEPLSFISSS